MFTPEVAPRVVVGVCGGIAAYKACELIRRLRSVDGVGADVTVVPTANALKFVGAATFEALSGHRVDADVFSDVPSVAHVSVGQHADLVVIAPATADLISRAAAGGADDLLTATLLVTRAPVLMSPAMHTGMWANPATQANVDVLRARGITVLDPAEGRLTGADSGVGRLPDPEIIAQIAEVLLHRGDALKRDLVGCRVVVTAGGTREPLDPVRFLGNRSSGRQGFALALIAAARGARVTLIAANTDLPTPPAVHLVPVATAAELRDATHAAARDADVVIMAAAVADFRPIAMSTTKIKKSVDSGPEPLQLATNPDILAELVQRRGSAERPVILGFAAETGDATSTVVEYGRAKLARKGCDFLVINDVSGGAVFGQPDNTATIVGACGDEITVPAGPKAFLAAAICDVIARQLAER
ncbi:MAG: bifunctional phosphopantothenoylcysteine decarboxylase/phosphopantothenate--cysteine ligase CoaBC [Nakamurella sp.]